MSLKIVSMPAELAPVGRAGLVAVLCDCREGVIFAHPESVSFVTCPCRGKHEWLHELMSEKVGLGG